MGYQLMSPPSGEPLTLPVVKQHLAAADPDLTADDAWITAAITAVRQYAEQETGCSLLTQTWRKTMDAWPACGEILLEKGPVTAISSITYTDMGESPATWSSAEYVADLSGQHARIAPRFGRVWPVALPQIGAIAVTFVAGYGDAAAVPEGIKLWMKARISALYENRDEWVVGKAVNAVPAIDSFLNAYRIRRV